MSFIRLEGFQLRYFQLGNYEFKFKKPTSASGVELIELLEKAKVCGSNPAGTCFLKQESLRYEAKLCTEEAQSFVSVSFGYVLFVKTVRNVSEQS